jgi:hypothetical protein
VVSRDIRPLYPAPPFPFFDSFQYILRRDPLRLHRKTCLGPQQPKMKTSFSSNKKAEIKNTAPQEDL